MGVTQGAGLSLKWFRDNFCQDYMERAQKEHVDPYYLMDQDAEKVPVGSNRLIYLPYLMGERTPHLNPDCRGVFFGLNAIHTKPDLIRAVMEGVSYSLTDCFDILKEMGVSVQNMTACGGGGTSSLWRQMLADMFNCQVKTTVSKEGPALGVAILAGVGAGLFPSVEEACRQVITINKTCDPISEHHLTYQNYHRLYQDLYPSLKPHFDTLASL